SVRFPSVLVFAAIMVSTAANAATAHIAWQPWGPAAFAQAAREHKIVVVDVGIEGCTACRYMHEETYRDEAVVKWIADNAIAISADADMQLDGAERFDPWGWPATAILTAEGRTLWMVRGHRPAARFVSILETVLADYQAGRPTGEIEKEAPSAEGDLEKA